MPRERIKERLRRIRADREQAEAGLNETGAKLVIGAETLRMLIELLDDPAKLYEQVIDSTRRKLNDAILERIYVNQDGVGTFVTTEPITELRDAQDAWFTSEHLGRTSAVYRRAAPVREHAPMPFQSHEKTASLPDRWINSSSKTVMVGVTGFELFTRPLSSGASTCNVGI